MSDSGRVPDDTSPDDARSGAQVEEAVDTAADGTPHDGTLRPPEASVPHTAPVEQVDDDPDMTAGQVVGDAGDPVDPPTAPPPEAAASGGAQSDPGDRASDRVAATDDD